MAGWFGGCVAVAVLEHFQTLTARYKRRPTERAYGCRPLAQRHEYGSSITV